MEYKIMGVPVRVGVHYLDRRRYIIRRGDYEGEAYTFSGAEEKISSLIKASLEKETRRVALNVYTNGDFPSATEKASYELDAYAQLRESEFRISVPAEVYESKPLMSLGEYLEKRRDR